MYFFGCDTEACILTSQNQIMWGMTAFPSYVFLSNFLSNFFHITIFVFTGTLITSHSVNTIGIDTLTPQIQTIPLPGKFCEK